MERISGVLLLVRVVDESMHVDVVRDLEEGHQECLSSTPVKSANGVGNVGVSSKLPSETPMKCPALVALMLCEEEKIMCEVAQSQK